jgi:signal transduction histidine kinase
MNQLFALLLLFARSLPALLKSTFNTGTKKIDRVEIYVHNVKGITQKLSDEIYQSFFTTRPTGQRTGLGLSLSYN